MTNRSGEIAMSSTSILTVLAESALTASPVVDATEVVGTPTLPKAVGVELTISSARTVGIGSKFRATRIDAGIATAVPNPAIPSMKHPKPHPMIRPRTRLSFDTLLSIALISSIAPVSSVSA